LGGFFIYLLNITEEVVKLGLFFNIIDREKLEDK